MADFRSGKYIASSALRWIAVVLVAYVFLVTKGCDGETQTVRKEPVKAPVLETEPAFVGSEPLCPGWHPGS